MVPANEALNFIMVIIIKNGFQVRIIKNSIYRKRFRIQPQMAPMAQKEDRNGPKRGPCRGIVVSVAVFLFSGCSLCEE